MCEGEDKGCVGVCEVEGEGKGGLRGCEAHEVKKEGEKLRCLLLCRKKKKIFLIFMM